MVLQGDRLSTEVRLDMCPDLELAIRAYMNVSVLTQSIIYAVPLVRKPN